MEVTILQLVVLAAVVVLAVLTVLYVNDHD
jgi:hypothetical protein